MFNSLASCRAFAASVRPPPFVNSTNGMRSARRRSNVSLAFGITLRPRKSTPSMSKTMPNAVERDGAVVAHSHLSELERPGRISNRACNALPMGFKPFRAARRMPGDNAAGSGCVLQVTRHLKCTRPVMIGDHARERARAFQGEWGMGARRRSHVHGQLCFE